MTIRDYEIICAVYEENSITKAATRLNISQPTVSNVIRALENNRGVLFQRSRAGCFPTDKGRYLYGVARAILNLDGNAENELKNHQSASVFRVGFYTAFGEGPLAALLDYIPQKTKYSILPVVGNHAELVSQVKLGLLDFAFTDFYLHDKDISAIPIMRDNLIFVASSGFPCRDTVSMEELADLPIIVREQGSGDYRTLETCFQIAHYAFRPWGIVSSNAALFALVRRGHGLACCSKVYYHNDINPDGLREVLLEGHTLSKKGYILVPVLGMNKHKKAVIQTIIQYLQELKLDDLAEIIPWDGKVNKGDT